MYHRQYHKGAYAIVGKFLQIVPVTTIVVGEYISHIVFVLSPYNGRLSVFWVTIDMPSSNTDRTGALSGV
jgi:hypothetical protein